MTNRSTHAIRWGIALTVLWAILVLLSFTPPQASASERSAEAVVLTESGAGRGPERAVEDLRGRVVREIPLVHGIRSETVA